MHLVRIGVLVALTAIAPAVLGAQQSATAQNIQRMRWYDAYNLGVKAVAAGNQWANAEAYLQQAKNAGPPQGRRVYYYGDTYLPFYPDYYLAIVYLNTNRQALAETAFADVKRRNLIDPKERQFSELEQLARRATFERSMDEARAFMAKGNLDEADKRAKEAKGTNFDNGKADSIQQEIVLLAKKPEPTPKPVEPSEPSPVQTPVTPIQQPVAVDVQNNPPVQPPTTPVTPPPPKPIYPTPTPPQNAASGAVAGPGGLLASAYVQFARAGLLAYFSGDYGEAVQQLEVIPENLADARVRVFLACARTAVVLTGRGDATVLRTARAGYRSAGGASALRVQDRRFISPKILELLEKS